MEQKKVEHEELKEHEKKARGIDQVSIADINDVKDYIMTKATTENLNSISSYVNARYEELKKQGKGSGLTLNKT